MPDHLWIVTRVFPPDEGGVQTYAREISEAYAALGWQVTIFAKSSAGPRADHAGPIRLIDVGPGSLVRTYVRLWRKMARAWAAGDRPRLIHACTWRAAIPALAFRAPLLIAVHGREVGRPRGIAFRLMGFVLSRAAAIVTVSAATRALLLARLPGLAAKTSVAWNGTAVTTPPAPRSGEAIAQVLTVCRLVARKNIVAGIAALAACRDAGADFRYHIVGRGPEGDAIARAIVTHRLQGRIQQLGFVEQAALDDLYGRCDVFLHPQITLEDGGEIEGFGISVADAMAHGIACVVGREGGPAELVEDGETGFVVDGRSEADIAAALDRLFADPALRWRMGAAASEWARETLTWRNHCERCLRAIIAR